MVWPKGIGDLTNLEREPRGEVQETASKEAPFLMWW